MSILIRGMEMPTSCLDCPLTDGHSASCLITKQSVYFFVNKRHNDCPLVPVSPHGDLIGREWLIDIALHLMNTAKNDDIANGVKWLLQYIIDAPTIIEAEG